MTPICWLEQSESDVPDQELWLSAAERAHVEGLRFPPRRSDWLLGRWTAKRAVAAYLDLSLSPSSLSTIEIWPGLDGAPFAMRAGRTAPVSFSISHRSGRALCAVGQAGYAIGCDLEAFEPRSAAFLSDYFTDEEHIAIIKCAGERWCPTVLWSAKESILKLLHVGLRLDTRAISIRLSHDKLCNGWFGFEALSLNEDTFRGWWQSGSFFVRTIAAFPPPVLPPMAIGDMAVDTAFRDILPFGKIRERETCSA